MDTLTFNAPILYRHLTFSEAKKEPINEINLQLALEGLEMEMSQFIDLCILLGCDYLEPIKGIGPKSALKLVREYGGLKGVVEHLREKYVICFASILSLMTRIGKRKRRRPRSRRRMGRRKGEVFRSPQSGHGKRRKKSLSSQT
jgi:5'-3' exonuclease